MKKKILLLIFSLIIILSSCSSNNDAKIEDENIKEETSEEESIEKNNNIKLEDQIPRPGGEIVIPILTNLDIEPFNPANSSIYYFSKLLYSSLFKYNDEGEIEGDIVENYSLSPDGTILSITIRDNIYFHDGHKLTSKDIVDTFNHIKYFEKESPYFNYFRYSIGFKNELNENTFLNMVIFDERNIDLHFDKSYKDILPMLTFPILKSSEIKSKEENPEYKYKNIGTGAFKYENIENGQFIKLIRNEEYYGRIPYLESVKGKLYSNSEYPKIGFETGQVDILNSDNSDYNYVKSDNNFRTFDYISNEMDLLIFNNSKEKFKGDNGRKLKRAIASSINKKRIIDRIFFGNAVETSIPINNNTLNKYELKSDTYYNTDNSKELLNELGYTELDNKGNLKKSNGEGLKIDIFTNKNDKQKNVIAEFIVEDLKTSGIDARIKNTPDNINLNNKDVLNHNLKNGDYDIALITVNLTDISDLGLLIHTNAIGNGLNYSSYSNYNLDNLLTNIKLTQSHEEIRNNYLEIISILSDDMPILPLYYKNKTILINDKIYGDLNPINSDIYRNFSNLYVVNE